MESAVTLSEAVTPELLEACLRLRREVFTGELGVPAEVERDEHDRPGDPCRQFLIVREGEGIGAVRCLPMPDRTMRLQRFCIRRACRGKSAGRQTLRALEALFRREGFTAVELDAKCSAQGFYAACGYETVSGVFEEAGVPHVAMRRAL